MTTDTQQAHATALIAATHALDERARAIEHAMNEEQLAWQPPTGGWSVGQVFEHLCVAHDSYLVVLRRLLAAPPAATARATAATFWRPSFAGRFLIRSMESRRRMPAPKMWRPAPVPRADVVGEFLSRQRELVALIERSAPFEWTRVRLGSPVSSLIRLNIGDAFTVLVRHAERHFGQIERIRAAQPPHIGAGAALVS
jgi:hypothetical protein